MKTNRWALRIATLGPIGYLTASGTVATLFTLPFVYWLHSFGLSQWYYVAIVSALFVCGLMVVTRALRAVNHEEDPSEIVFDEFVGALLVFWGVTLSPQSVLVGFLIFRALDVISCTWVKRAEDLVGAWGVMGDDIVAALITNIILRLLIHGFMA